MKSTDGFVKIGFNSHGESLSILRKKRVNETNRRPLKNCASVSESMSGGTHGDEVLMKLTGWGGGKRVGTTGQKESK